VWSGWGWRTDSRILTAPKPKVFKLINDLIFQMWPHIRCDAPSPVCVAFRYSITTRFMHRSPWPIREWCCGCNVSHWLQSHYNALRNNETRGHTFIIPKQTAGRDLRWTLQFKANFCCMLRWQIVGNVINSVSVLLHEAESFSRW